MFKRWHDSFRIFSKELTMSEPILSPDPQDATMNLAIDRFSSSYPGNSGAINWQSIIAAIMSLLGGCIPMATPSSTKAICSNPGPFVRIRLRRKLNQMGVSNSHIDGVMEAVFKAGQGATEAEVGNFIAACQD